MIDKRVRSAVEAVAGLTDGMTLLVGGFGDVGVPFVLLEAVLETGARDLTIVSNNAGTGETGISALLREYRVRKVVCSYPRTSGSVWFEERYRAKDVELELVPQGTLSERIRCAGAGLDGVLTPVGVGTALAEGCEQIEIDGWQTLIARPIHADFAIIKAHKGDRWGNLTYRKAARNFGPVMAMAADVVAAQITEFSELGDLDPESIVSPGVFIDRLLVTGLGA